MRTLARVLLSCCLASHLDAQSEAQSAYRAIIDVVESAGPERPARTTRIALLREFLDRFAGTIPTDDESTRTVLAARCRLATLLLSRFELHAAATEFRAVVEEAGPVPADLRGSAMYGLAQALELDGQKNEATSLLDRLAKDLPGTRYSDYARIALHRMRNEEPVMASRPLPSWGVRLDTAGASRTLEEHRGRRCLLFFWSVDEPDQTERLTKLVAVARAEGMGWNQMLAFASGRDRGDSRELAIPEGWEMPIVPLDSGFLDSLIMGYGITSIPTSFLVGADGELLARDLPPRRLRAVLKQLASRHG
jgi:hypothetical protein